MSEAKDIVQRLRRGVYPDETGFGSTEDAMKEAADEIERLRAVVDMALDAAAEIERLRADKADLIAALKTLAVYFPDIWVAPKKPEGARPLRQMWSDDD